MFVFTKTADLQTFLNDNFSKKKIGFVPTMGALHLGHLSLVQQSIRENQVTVISIFVNPTQFNNIEDLKKYPRTLEKDIEKLQLITNSLVVFAPSVDEMYAKNVISTVFDYDGLEHQMEGKHRIGHFNGVGTIVKKLFEIVQPTKAYFGEKDYQQLQIIKKMVEKHQLPVLVIECPIYREKNGLAMSSRNERLSPEAREKASIIYKTLQNVKENFNQKSIQKHYIFVTETFKKHTDFALEYFEIADEKTLKSAKYKRKNKKFRGFIAVWIEGVRLIDNLSLT